MTRKTFRMATVLVAITVLAVGRFAGSAGAMDPDARALVHNAAGDVIAVVKMADEGSATAVKVTAEGLAPGFHGFHVHATGTCTAPSFTSAGGHYNPDGDGHGTHAGDLPVLLVNSDGTASARFVTDGFDVADVIGRSLIVHAAPDNYGNVPVGSGATEYTPNSTGTTNTTATGLTANTGNAGGRTGCGVIEAA